MAVQGTAQEARAEFDRFYEAYFPRVYGLMRKHQPGLAAAEAATRAVMAELVETLDGLSEPEIKRKLIQIARRQLRNR